MRRVCAWLIAIAFAVVGMLPPHPVAAREPGAANPDLLWKIIHELCVPNALQGRPPEPCARVDLEDGPERGYALLKDTVGPVQYLLIPTARVPGIETAFLWTPEAPNYFAPAWRYRSYVEELLHRQLQRDGISLAVNSAVSRSQNQLHIHIDCTREAVRKAVARRAHQVGDSWADFPELLAGHHYRAMRIMSAELNGADPFKLLAHSLPEPATVMGQHTLVVIGADFADGQPGFVLLDGQVDLTIGNLAHGTELQDHSCGLPRPSL
jgi:CDP-diacylglycerol pyrophosphatase